MSTGFYIRISDRRSSLPVCAFRGLFPGKKRAKLEHGKDRVLVLPRNLFVFPFGNVLDPRHSLSVLDHSYGFSRLPSILPGNRPRIREFCCISIATLSPESTSWHNISPPCSNTLRMQNVRQGFIQAHGPTYVCCTFIECDVSDQDFLLRQERRCTSGAVKLTTLVFSSLEPRRWKRPWPILGLGSRNGKCIGKCVLRRFVLASSRK